MRHSGGGEQAVLAPESAPSPVENAAGRQPRGLLAEKPKPSIQDYSLDELLTMAAERQASDVHLTANLPPTLRVDGRLRPMNFGRLEQGFIS